MTRTLFFPAILAAALASAGPALAHAFLKTATPAVGSTLAAAPPEVVINFTEGVEPRFSTIEVQDAAGNRVDTGAVRTAPRDVKRLMTGLKPLRPGTYLVTWHATSTDTHKTQGSYRFTVSP